MKIWLDDLRPAPKEYIWCRSVNEAIRFIKSTDCTHKDEKEISFEKASDRLIMKIKQRQEKIKEIQKRIENL